MTSRSKGKAVGRVLCGWPRHLGGCHRPARRYGAEWQTLEGVKIQDGGDRWGRKTIAVRVGVDRFCSVHYRQMVAAGGDWTWEGAAHRARLDIHHEELDVYGPDERRIGTDICPAGLSGPHYLREGI